MSDTISNQNVPSATTLEMPGIWENKTRMAWSAFFMIFVFAVISLSIICFAPLPDFKIQAISEIACWVFTTCGGIIAAYFGVSGWAYVRRNQQ